MKWKNKEILQETELTKYEEDEDSLFFYKARFFWVKYPFLISLAVFCGSILSHNKIIGMSAFLTLIITAVFWKLVQNNTKATCQKCKRNMHRYMYTNNRKGYSPGTVYICTSCNTKFVYATPEYYQS